MVAMVAVEAAAMMGGEVVAGDPRTTFEGAALDSRRVLPGMAFFAFPGARSDGHEHVEAALEAGAAVAVVEGRYTDLHGAEVERWGRRGTVVRVRRGIDALHALTRELRRRLPEKIVGITGSAGKTTTKELLAAMLARKFRVARSPGNFNNLLGFPLALLAIPEDTEWMVAEMGMSQPGELGRLSRLARPDVAVFTNVRPAHLEFHGTLRAITEAKAELLAGLADGGLVVANADDPEVRRIAQRHEGPVVFFGRGPDAEAHAEVRAEDVEVAGAGETGSRFTLVVGDRRVPVRLPLHGLYNVENCLAAAACAWSLGVDLEDVARAVETVTPVGGRGAVHRLPGDVTVIDDAYNANPDAVERALESAAQLPARRHWAVLGDMLELGVEAPRFHRETGAAAARLGFDPVLAVGELAAALAEGVREGGSDGRVFASAAAAAPAAAAELRSGDLVLVKGSRGVGLDVVVEALRADRPVAEGGRL